ncbi:hypothetical protein JQS43_09340 [Natronosporangium hydrolyticum]|uniref:Uncharacterized protein n=1 Tax=Natronosporangium hydrolyticum TaxID=2811111 RepID=A0A895YR17_9ACTN|nr:hypothetical protein [Natronosporangium hydrolyticum]QSB16458.1 hypothetical protein JQS43_09340 [Natronosporangium hydrolyticum]
MSDRSWPFLGINLVEAYQAGQRVGNEATPAGRLANWFREELLTAENVVRHHVMVTAIDEYREVWVAHANEAARQVRRLGDGTCAATATVEGADVDASCQQQPVGAAVAGQQSLLSRPVDGGSVVT